MAGSVRKTSKKKTSAKKGSRKSTSKGSRKKTSRRKASKRKASLRKNGNLTWVGFVKKYQKDNDLESYGQAMREAKEPWIAYKDTHGIE